MSYDRLRPTPFSLLPDQVGGAEPDPIVSRGLLPGVVEQSIEHSGLTYREHRMLVLRFGLNGEEPHQYKELAPLWNITPGGARGIVERALRKLRQPKVSRDLRDFYS